MFAHCVLMAPNIYPYTILSIVNDKVSYLQPGDLRFNYKMDYLIGCKLTTLLLFRLPQYLLNIFSMIS